MRVLVLAVAATVLPALAGADSLGGAARKQARLLAEPRAAETKSYSEADLAARSSPATDTAVPPAVASARESVAATPDVAPQTQDSNRDLERSLEREREARLRKEAYWRGAAANARGRVATAQKAYDYTCAGGVLLTGG